MAWFKGSTTDSHDMIDILSSLGDDEHISALAIHDGGSGYAIGDTAGLSSGSYDYAPEAEVRSIVTADTVATIATIPNGGTGYAVGDTINLVGGTSTVVAVLEVTTEAGGVVTGLQINNPGAYSVQPGGTVTTAKITGSGDDALTVTLTWNSAVAGIATSIFISHAGASTVPPTNPVATTATVGVGTGLKLDATWAETAWETLMKYEPKVAVSAVIAAGGTGYAVDDLIIVNVGAGTAPENAVFKVASIAGSAVATVTLNTEGYYAALPSNPAATTADPATPGGSGCTLTVTYGDYTEASWDSFKFLVMHNTVEDVYVGVEAVHRLDQDADLWRLEPLTGFNTLSTKFSEQPGYDDSESFVALHDSAFDYVLSVDDRRIFGNFNLGSGAAYNSMYIGLFDPLMTADEYPYPQLVLGMQSFPYKFTYSSFGIGGIPNPGSKHSSYNGPGILRLPSGTPTQFRNWKADAGSLSPTTDRPGLTPIVNQNSQADLAAERWYSNDGGKSFANIVTYTDTDAVTTDQLARFGSTYTLLPLMVSDYTRRRFLGQLSGAYWFDNADGSLNAGDRIWIGVVAYRVYHNNKKTNKNNFFCVEEA